MTRGPSCVLCWAPPCPLTLLGPGRSTRISSGRFSTDQPPDAPCGELRIVSEKVALGPLPCCGPTQVPAWVPQGTERACLQRTWGSLIADSVQQWMLGRLHRDPEGQAGALNFQGNSDFQTNRTFTSLGIHGHLGLSLPGALTISSYRTQSSSFLPPGHIPATSV